MKKLIAVALLLVVGMQVYDMFRPIQPIVEAHVVRSGDTLYNICNRHYISKNNSECFNEFWHRVMKEHGKTALEVGDIVWVTNRVYK